MDDHLVSPIDGIGACMEESADGKRRAQDTLVIDIQAHTGIRTICIKYDNGSATMTRQRFWEMVNPRLAGEPLFLAEDKLLGPN